MSEHRKSFFTVPVSGDHVYDTFRAIDRARLWARGIAEEFDDLGYIIESISITTHGTATVEAVVRTAEASISRLEGLGSHAADLKEMRAQTARADRLQGAIDSALVHLSRIGPPENSCVDYPVCADQEAWPPEQWCDACLANAAKASLTKT